MHDKKLPFGKNYCKCTACGEYFGGVGAFDLHRVGAGADRACLAPSAVANKEKQTLLRFNDRGYWVRSY
jgi:hypothetical protein